MGKLAIFFTGYYVQGSPQSYIPRLKIPQLLFITCFSNFCFRFLELVFLEICNGKTRNGVSSKNNRILSPNSMLRYTNVIYN